MVSTTFFGWWQEQVEGSGEHSTEYSTFPKGGEID
jgi:hypothetical protein